LAKLFVVEWVWVLSAPCLWPRVDVADFAKQEMQQELIHYERVMMLKA
jgi:hypothetical protein